MGEVKGQRRLNIGAQPSDGSTEGYGQQKERIEGLPTCPTLSINIASLVSYFYVVLNNLIHVPTPHTDRNGSERGTSYAITIVMPLMRIRCYSNKAQIQAVGLLKVVLLASRLGLCIVGCQKLWVQASCTFEPKQIMPEYPPTSALSTKKHQQSRPSIGHHRVSIVQHSTRMKLALGQSRRCANDSTA